MLPHVHQCVLLMHVCTLCRMKARAGISVRHAMSQSLFELDWRCERVHARHLASEHLRPRAPAPVHTCAATQLLSESQQLRAEITSFGPPTTRTARATSCGASGELFRKAWNARAFKAPPLATRAPPGAPIATVLAIVASDAAEFSARAAIAPQTLRTRSSVAQLWRHPLR